MPRENKFKLLCETITTLDQNENSKMMQGEARPIGPKRMTLNDIVNQYNKDKDEDGDIKSKAPGQLPAPLTNNHIEAFADLYTKSTALQTDITAAAKNPIIKDNDRKAEAAKKIVSYLDGVKDLVKKIGDELDIIA